MTTPTEMVSLENSPAQCGWGDGGEQGQEQEGGAVQEFHSGRYSGRRNREKQWNRSGASDRDVRRGSAGPPRRHP